jgi:hypothetical protein
MSDPLRVVSEQAHSEQLSRRRKGRTSVISTGLALVTEQLLIRGFEARRASNITCQLVIQSPSSPIRIDVRAVHVAPWYVHGKNFLGARANRVTVYVLLGLAGVGARFFVARNGDLEPKFRKPIGRKAYAFIDLEAVKQYEDNWMILRT